jgi:diaminohydroxyphosphoribosylaminopyrimidine deaminase / 5-amino-6-(5-phosphoribosylamino)uracil reductase
MPEALDRRFLAAAIRQGSAGLGSTWPNPSVGAIVIKDQRVVGRGRTGRGGRPHGEAAALDMAGDAARGATLYVSLEPCAHHGKTPPCTDAIVAAGIARVVATRLDPDPRVAGKGLRRLREAGVEVRDGRLGPEAGRAHAGHFSRVLRGRPHVLLKLAVTVDGAIGRRGEPQTPVSGAIARRHAQALRARADAILVGRGTVEADDPQLTCRLPGLEHRSPVRVVLDSRSRLPSDRKVFDDAAPTWVFGATAAAAQAPGLRRFHAPATAEGLDLHACLARLAGEGITRVLVEGGA